MKLSSLSKVVKGISNKAFMVELMERSNGRYYVQYKRRFSNLLNETEDLVDFNLASTLFEMIINEVEGN